MNEAQLGGRSRCCRNPAVSRAAWDQLTRWANEKTEVQVMTSEVKAVVSDLSDEHIDLQRENAAGLRLCISDCTCIKFDTSGAGGVMGEVVVKKNHQEVLIFGPRTAGPSV